jgi:phosphate transport system protein
MTRQFHQRIEAVKQRVVAMAELSKKSVLEGVRSLTDQDMKLAEHVIARDKEINRMDVEIESEAIDLIALNQPMGRDLRTLAASLKIITYLDRIGRYGYDVARITKQMEGKEHIKRLVVIPHMAEQATRMLTQAIEAYQAIDAHKARGIAAEDELVDALYEQILRECVTFMVEDPRVIGVAAHYILVARHLERVGDNAAKIAEKVLYMATGERRSTA